MKFDQIVNSILNEEEDPSEYNSKYYDDAYKGYANTAEDFEFLYQDQPYMATISYDIENIVHPGDYDTPDFHDVNINELVVTQLWSNNPETGDWDEFNKEQNPQLWDAVAKAAESAFLDNESNWNPEY